jgi:hypothetical protein
MDILKLLCEESKETVGLYVEGSSSSGNIITFPKVSTLLRYSLSIGSFRRRSLDSGYLRFRTQFRC